MADHDKLLLGALLGTVTKSHKLRRDTQGLDHRASTSSYGCYYELYIFFLEIMYYCGVFFIFTMYFISGIFNAYVHFMLNWKPSS